VVTIHFLQGFWYRFLVDAFIYEKMRGLEDEKLSEFLLGSHLQLSFFKPTGPEGVPELAGF
jgi:hypothetical protein